VLLPRLGHIVGQAGRVLPVDALRQLIESRDKRMLHPIDQNFREQHGKAVGQHYTELGDAPVKLLHGLDDHNEQKHRQMESLSYIAAGQLEQVVFVELLEHGSLELHEIIRYHDGQQALVVGVHRHIQTGGLKE